MFKTIINNFHLEKLIWIIKSKFLYMLLAALIGAVLTGGYATLTQTSTYRAQISFYVYSNPDYVTDTGVNLSSSDITQANSLLTSYMQILNSATFLNEIIDYTGLEQYTVEALQKRISAAAVSNTAVFKVSVLDQNPVNAMNIANAIGDLAPDEIISIVKSGGIEVLDAAELPTEPYTSTSVLMYALIGAVLGFAIVAAWCVIKGLLNTTIRRKYEIEDMFTIPILGEVPQQQAKDKKEAASVRLDQDNSFGLKEAYSNIRVGLLFTKKGEKCPIYAVTSADCHEGKTTSAFNMAVSYAQMNKKVLLIDADMRNSSMKEFLQDAQWNDTDGLSEYLAEIADKPAKIAFEKNLDIIPSGTMPPNPSELLVSERWYQLLQDSQKEYDAIFVDFPSLGIVSDALCLAQVATTYVLVIRENLTRIERIEMIVRRLESLDADICGFIYNGISQKSPDYNYKLYGKEYKKD